MKNVVRIKDYDYEYEVDHRDMKAVLALLEGIGFKKRVKLTFLQVITRWWKRRNNKNEEKYPIGEC